MDHLRACGVDECGAMNEFLAAAPRAQVAHGALGCMVSLDDLCDRPPRKLADGEVIDIGGKRRSKYRYTRTFRTNWEVGGAACFSRKRQDPSLPEIYSPTPVTDRRSGRRHRRPAPPTEELFMPRRLRLLPRLRPASGDRLSRRCSRSSTAHQRGPGAASLLLDSLMRTIR